MKRTFLGVAVLLSACVTPPTATTADQAEYETPLICQGEQCQLAWRRAQLWIVQNSNFKIQSATDVVIQTYNGDRYSPHRHYTVIREPLDGQRDQIKIASGCQNIFGCSGDWVIIAAKFKRFVRTGTQ